MIRHLVFLVSGIAICLTSVLADPVGTVSEQTAPGEIKREKSNIDTKKGTGIQMDDLVKTYKGKIGLTFIDDTRVQITENSSLIIDDFVYDPVQDTGKLALNVALGTVRYASGAIAKNNRENVKLKTPSATVTVRGTDFTMTVDETGKSLFILLPSCPPTAKSDADCWVGEIKVETDTGFVILNQAYQATVTVTSSMPPSSPIILNIDPSNINNMLIISPPQRVQEQQDEYDRRGALDEDLLAYQELSINELDEQLFATNELDLNLLDQNFLENILDVLARQLSLSIEQLGNMQDAYNAILPNIKNSPETVPLVDEVNIFLRRESASHLAEIRVGLDTNGRVITSQDSIINDIQLNSGGSNVQITIIQSN